MKYRVIVEKDEYGYVGEVIGLDGCYTQGKTLEELIENLKEAISLYLPESAPPMQANVMELTMAVA